MFDHDVVFKSLSLAITNSGVVLSGAVTINGHSTAAGEISIQKDGLYISGSIGDVDIESVSIKNARFDVFIGSSTNDAACSRTTKFGIGGEVSFCGIDLEVALFLEKAGGTFDWTIYGEAKGDLLVSRLNPDLKGTFLDVSLSSLALIASSKEKPDGPYNKFRYPVRKGIQLCAAIESIPQLEDLLRGSVKGSTLCVSLGPDGSANLSIKLPSDRTMSFGDNVYTGPLEIEFGTRGADIHLLVKAGLNIKVDTQPDPIAFNMGLTASLSGASAYAQMTSDWVNPCNVGKKVIIRAGTLDIGIVYATFFTTGMPGSIGMGGMLMIGQKEAKVATKISQNPKEQLLVAGIKDLGVVDLVHFASLVCDCSFPEPPNFVHFDDLQLYLSTGATLGETYYPPGVSLKGDMSLFGKRAKFDCSIGSSMVKVMATIEHFELGPLTVRGAVGEDPIVDVELSAAKQKVLIDGAVDIWGLTMALHLDAEIQPQPKFDFWLNLSLSDWFKVQLEAKLTGDIDFKNMSSLANAEFSIHGLMEQDILQHIIDLLDKQIDSMGKNGDFDEAMNRLEQKEREHAASIEAAQRTLQAARDTWAQKESSVKAELENARSQAESHLEALRSKAHATEQTFSSARASASAALEQARYDAAVAIREAESALHHAEHDSDETIRQAQDSLHQKRDAFDVAFGQAEQDLETARLSVKTAAEAVDTVNEEMGDVDRRISEAQLFDMLELAAEKAAKTAELAAAVLSLEVTRALVSTAETLVQGDAFVTSRASIEADEAALVTLLDLHAAAVSTAQSALDKVRSDQEALIRRATRALYEVERTSPELSALSQAQAAIIAGEATARAMVKDAELAFKGLSKCAEYLAVERAEKALLAAESDSTEVELARQACDLLQENASSFADDILQVGCNIGKWIASAAAELINIRKIEFSGSTASFKEGGPPLSASISGTLVGVDFDIKLEWKPDFDLVKFVKGIFTELWDKIKNAAVEFLKEIGAIIVKVAEEVVEFVEDAAEAIAEGAEVVGEAIVEGAEVVGEAVAEAAEEIGNAVDDIAKDVGEAASDVGSAIGHVAEDVDEAMSDVGSALGNAANDVEDAVSDVGSALGHAASDVGDAFNDVGNGVENVANDIGNAISDAFSFW